MAKKKKEKDLSDFKPRNEHLNEVLLSRPAGRMKDKTETPRSRDKERLKQGKWESYEA